MLSLFSIALHNRDSPTDVIPRPGNRTLRHTCGTSAASPFRTRCLSFAVRTLVGRASIFHMKLAPLYTQIHACQEEIKKFRSYPAQQAAERAKMRVRQPVLPAEIGVPAVLAQVLFQRESGRAQRGGHLVLAAFYYAAGYENPARRGTLARIRRKRDYDVGH